MIAPSAPNTGPPRPSDNTAIFFDCSGASITPMNFNVIGGAVGGGGGPIGAGLTGTAGCVTGGGGGGGGGGTFGLNRKRFRSAAPGFGHSFSSASRWTPGPAGAPDCACAFSAAPPTRLDDRPDVAHVAAGHIR